MGLKFGSAEWARALEEEIQGSSEYRNAAAGWGIGFNGNILFAFEADEAMPKPSYLLIRLDGGSCQGVEFVESPTVPEAGFVLRAPFSVWREILERKSLAATAILTGRMRVDGDKMTLLRFTSAHRALVHCTGSIDTTFE